MSEIDYDFEFSTTPTREDIKRYVETHGLQVEYTEENDSVEKGGATYVKKVEETVFSTDELKNEHGYSDSEIREQVLEDTFYLQERFDRFENDLIRTIKRVVGDGTLKLNGRNLGWRNTSGEATSNVEDIVQDVTPRGEWSMYVTEREDSVVLRVTHHDSPMLKYADKHIITAR